MTEESITLESHNTKLVGYKWEREEQPKAVICLVHGMGEHIKRHTYLIDFLVEQNYAVVGFDLRGHGRSGGKRGHTKSYDVLLDDIDVCVKYARSAFKKSSIFILGHSLGGNLVLNYSLRRNPKLDGIIISAPWIKLAFEPPAIQLIIGKYLSKIAPSLTQKSNLDTKAISQIEKEVLRYEQDALVHDKISVSMFFCVREAGLWLIDNSNKLKSNLLIYHGTGDKLTSFDTTKEFVDSIINKELVEFHIFSNAFHEIHNDKAKDELFGVINQWLSTRLGLDLIAMI